jgi:glycosyltransferase involved in cell wall biosynthesis
MKFRFHILGLPHTVLNTDYVACAYTMKALKFVQMMSARGHECIVYANEGTRIESAEYEFVQVLSEDERSKMFGPHDKTKFYDVDWNPQKLWWRISNERSAHAIQKRVRKYDFILSWAGWSQVQAIGDQFPGSWTGNLQDVAMVEPGIGYYSTKSRYRVYESHSHREWCMGRMDQKNEDNDSAVIGNYWDMRDFPPNTPSLYGFPSQSYYLFIGRITATKGWNVAVDVTREIGARLVIAGQGKLDIEVPSHVTMFGHADAEQRAALMTHAIATFAPTHYREPFGGTAAEAQLCGTPVITTDHGAFTETVQPEWRCTSHREFCEAAERAKSWDSVDMKVLRQMAVNRWSFGAIAPQFERYFERILSRHGKGWYDMRPLEQILGTSNSNS